MNPAEFDAATQLRTATRRAKSDVANKMVSMFLHLLSRRFCEAWRLRIEDSDYVNAVRQYFGADCVYCRTALAQVNVAVEHPDGMNRLRVGLHVPGNVVLACRRCNNEKRRDDSLGVLRLASTGWESFLSHTGNECEPTCATCAYWKLRWPDTATRVAELQVSISRLREFRSRFPQFERVLPSLRARLPSRLAELYEECQSFAETRIATLVKEFVDDADLWSSGETSTPP